MRDRYGDSGADPDGHTGADPGRGPRMLEIGEDHAGQRIDNFLIATLKGVPRSLVYRCLRRGEVRVNRGRIRQHYRLKTGDQVRVPPIRTAQPSRPPEPAGVLAERIEHCVRYEDAHLLVLDKPSGLAVHGGSGVRHGVIEVLRAARGPGYLELVHRLDRETSGCLVVAKRRGALVELHRALREEAVDKRYLALVAGRWRQAGTIDAALARDVGRSGERIVSVRRSGKPSRTHFVPLTASGRGSLVEAKPLTGRTHQIRVHATHAGHPIAGDEKYGDRDFNQATRDLGLRRLFLHCAGIAFAHPGTGERLSIEAPLPPALGSVLERLGLGRPPPARR